MANTTSSTGRLRKSVLSLSCLLLLAGGLLGCGSSEGPELGDWTLQEEALSLTEDVRVSETEDFFFGSVSGLDVTSDGRMVVADGQANNIKVLHPDGSLIDTLGGAGEGPGEFQMLRTVRVAQGDSLYAYDIQPSRLTVFVPGSGAPYQVDRLISLPRDQGLIGRVYVLGEHLAGSFGGTSLEPEEGIMKPDPSVLRQFDREGTPGDTLLVAESSRIALDMVDEGGFRVEGIPFDRQTALDEGPDGRIYHGWTDSLHIEAVAPDGASDVVASVPTEPLPVTGADRDSALSEIDDGVRSMVASAIPDTKPAFTDLVVAGDGRLWVQRPAKAPGSDTVPWWVLNPDDKMIQKVRLPEEVQIEVVKGNRVYGSSTTDLGAPAVVRYRVEQGTD